jgi:hypothetical protein
MRAPETGDDLRREEGKAFKAACISAALALSIYAGVTIFVWLNAGKIAGLTAAGAPAWQIGKLRVESMIALEFGGVIILLCALAFARYFVNWLIAIRRRRREGGGLPPAA